MRKYRKRACRKFILYAAAHYLAICANRERRNPAPSCSTLRELLYKAFRLSNDGYTARGTFK